MTKLARLFRRIILRNFGGYKKFVLFVSVIFMVLYIAKSIFMTQNVTAAQQDSEVENVTVSDDVTTIQPNSVCGVSESCPTGRLRFYILSGYRTSKPPRICFNGKDYIGTSAVNGRGVSIVVIDEVTLTVEDVMTFDTYTSGKEFHDYLMHNITDYRIILFATFDDVTRAMMVESRKLLSHFGSTKINVLQFRDALVFVGQKGLTQGSAIEKHVRRYMNRDFAEQAELTGCISSAVGKLTRYVVEEANPEFSANMKCGVSRDCGKDGFPVHIYSGYQNSEAPRLCIDGKKIMEKEAGRGFNVAVVDPKTKEVVKSGRFDTYEFRNTSLAKFLESVNDEQIVVAVTHDEVTMNLTPDIKQQFERLGSFYISKLAMRDAWCFIGQRGLEGRSPYEELEFAPTGGNTWSDVIDRKFCIPSKLKGFSLVVAEVERNTKRIDFCRNYVGYGEFCAGGRNDEIITPAPLLDEQLLNNVAFSIPILIVPGANKNAFRLQLESIINNPGIRPEMVSVYFSKEFEEYSKLIDLFAFKSFSLDMKSNYSELLMTALEEIWWQHKDSKYVIVFEEEVMARRHYLSFIAQCLSVVEADKSLIGISGWNENGFLEVSTIPNYVYRTETIPGLGFLLKKSFYDAHMKGRMTSCCSDRSWNGWLRNTAKDFEMLVPDTSFVMRRPFEDTTLPEYLVQLFNRPRAYQKRDPVLVRNKGELTKDRYEEALIKLLRSSTALLMTNISATGCFGMIPAGVTEKSFSIYFEQSDGNDDSLLSRLCQCFKLLYLPNYKPPGKHNGIVRFSVRKNHVLLIGSRTKYFAFKPEDHQPLKIRS